MMTQTHLLIAVAAFARPGEYARNSAAMAGGLLPDTALYALIAISRVQGISMQEIFRVRYWSPQWQAWMAPGNSLPLYLLVLAAGLALWRFAGARQAGFVLMVLAGAALMHIALDWPLHVNDGHAHLWPFTDWRFRSPVSYWDGRHFANYVRPVEFAIGLTCLALVFRRFHARWIRGLVALTMALYVAEPLYFLFWF